MKTIKVPIEADITYVNKAWFTNKNNKRASDEKHYVIGFFQREGNAIIIALDNNSVETICDAFYKSVAKGCTIYAEKNVLPEELNKDYSVVTFETSTKDIHINNVKNMWKSLKRLVKEVHISVSKKHLQLYCNEVQWRTNTRNLSQEDKFMDLMSRSVSKRTTYQDLTK